MSFSQSVGLISSIKLWSKEPNWELYADSVDKFTKVPIHPKIPYNESRMITFECKNVQDGERYKYILEGHDPQYQEIENFWYNPIAIYEDLPPGFYTFKVCESFDCENTLSSFSFTILKPFWQKTWFQISVILGIGGIFGGILSFRYNSIRKKDELKRKFTETELKAIRAQMNPHFIFNSLSSIQNLINKNDTINANIYLSKFASLMRTILDNSEYSTVSLEKEIEGLDYYLTLEVLRFKFDYQIIVDEKLDKHNVQVPSMLIQPFVENSIIHGISGKTDGKITIEFIKKETYIECIVEDNGIGREKSLANKRDSSTKHKSHGMRLAKERLDIINSVNHTHLSMKIIDLKDEFGNANGTRVEIYIPIQN